MPQYCGQHFITFSMLELDEYSSNYKHYSVPYLKSGKLLNNQKIAKLVFQGADREK